MKNMRKGERRLDGLEGRENLEGVREGVIRELWDGLMEAMVKGRDVKKGVRNEKVVREDAESNEQC